MTITMHGASCDVCDNYILPIGDEMVHTFSIFGISNLHCDNKCKERILALDTSKPEFWHDLPDGRVRRVADEIAARDAVLAGGES